MLRIFWGTSAWLSKRSCGITLTIRAIIGHLPERGLLGNTKRKAPSSPASSLQTLLVAV
ncbi:hypothetical protein SERLA73DRAFT_77731 [Serpula lacrymans var. lacrymans S7.3]|uniref:Uncharacterized protein n=1 Tax=Serpula lacrymans var. lacrymans (strain S7.3) TaxID=936435 RepID=F8QAS5_SERL3|nr:hypothetical protein SERLA73DRAFT_77731 [Serpula lacrymans var. lacrymans S7.3]